MLLFVHQLLEVHSLTPSLYILSTDTFLYRNLIFIAENHVYKYFDDIYNDVIPMPQFLTVVRQHILGVVGNAMYCFVANLTDFPAVKEL